MDLLAELEIQEEEENQECHLKGSLEMMESKDSWDLRD